MSVNIRLLQYQHLAVLVSVAAAAPAAHAEEAPAEVEATEGDPAEAEEYPDEVSVDATEDRERFAESTEDNWGIPEALELYRRSEDLYDEGRYQEAAAFLLRVIELDPNAPELYYNIALVYEHLQEYDRALEYLDQYRQFDVGGQERRRIERMMDRIRGAREHLPPNPEPQTRTRVVVRRFGRADGLFWGVVGATVLFTAGAAITGGLALNWSEGTDQFTVGLDGDLAEYRSWVNVADDLALTTDIFIGVASASALAALLLYVLRTHPEIEVREEIEQEDEADDAEDDSSETTARRRGRGERPSRARPAVQLGLAGVRLGWEF